MCFSQGKQLMKKHTQESLNDLGRKSKRPWNLSQDSFRFLVPSSAHCDCISILLTHDRQSSSAKELKPLIHSCQHHLSSTLSCRSSVSTNWSRGLWFSYPASSNSQENSDLIRECWGRSVPGVISPRSSWGRGSSWKEQLKKTRNYHCVSQTSVLVEEQRCHWEVASCCSNLVYLRTTRPVQAA